MNRTRSCSVQRLYGMSFLLAVIGMIGFIHFSFVVCVMLPLYSFWPQLVTAVLIVYSILFTGLLASFYQCVLTDPGVVPANWGFYMGDDSKRRRYCKMCNVWKPDRTHHCSICNRCILNMDHHCPWINNCVGFYNRKFFVQLLLYIFATLTIVFMFSVPTTLARMGAILRGGLGAVSWRDPLRVVSSVLAALIAATLSNFIRFHLKLVRENYTTIENLERDDDEQSPFDIGEHRNVEQVFGSLVWLWWLPMHIQCTRPTGDGVRWRVLYSNAIDEDEFVDELHEGLQPSGRECTATPKSCRSQDGQSSRMSARRARGAE